MGIFSKLLGQSANKNLEKIDIVGESFYKESFSQLRATFGAKVGQRVAVKVELRIETDNPHAFQGKAVAAFINGLPVGHVSSIQVQEAFAAISAEGGIKVVPGSVLFADHRESVAKNSVLADYQVKKFIALGPTQEEIALKQAKSESNRAQLAELKNDGWSRLKVKPGNTICFTQFGELSAGLEDQAKEFGLILANGVVKDLDLLVVNDQYFEKSAKVIKALGYGVQVTNLQTFLETNPLLKPQKDN